MRLTTYLMVSITALTSVEADTSRHFSSYYDCSGGSYHMCTNMAPLTCYNSFVREPVGSLNSAITSILFTGLPPTSIASMYESDTKNKCAKNIKSGNGLSLCLSTGRRVDLPGSAYFDVLGCATRPAEPLCTRDGGAIDFARIEAELLGTPGNCTATVRPDILAMGDGTFYRIGEGVPQDKVVTLYELAAEHDAALEARDIGAEGGISLPVAEHLLEFRVQEEDIDAEWL